MKLLILNLKNFKGIKSFTLDALGGNVSIYGDNATGKTTLADAFLWLMFDKDSQNRKDFQIKTVDKHGNEIHGLDHEVEAVLEVNGQEITLRKVYSEKWTKKRGSAEKTFTGHTTDHYINGVPVKKKEFSDKVAEIADEDAFRLLTDPRFFNEYLHWQDRRKILLEVCGDISDEDVIASDKSLARLPEILQGRKLEDHRKIILARRTEINKELERIPVRIDEVEQNLPDVTGLNQKSLAADLVELEKKLEAKQAEISRIKNGGEVAEKTKQMRELESRLIEIKNKHRTAVDELAEEKRAKLHVLTDNEAKLRLRIGSNKQAIKDNESLIKDIDSLTESLRNQWYRVNALEFCHEDRCTCPTCGQDLPQDQVEAAREKALAEFNRKKAEELEEINANGKREKEKADRLLAENKALSQEIEDAEKSLGKTRAEAEQLRNEIDSMIASAGQPHETLEYKELQAQAEKLDREISDLQMGDRELLAMAREDEAAIKEQIQSVQDELRMFRDRKAGEERIQELTNQEKKLATEYEQLEKELYLTEQFVRSKVSLLEEKINSRFQMARFKLFNVLVNGGVEECCETMVDGVPYTSLNNAARINVGLDIINTLAEHYGFDAPIFIDNAEAVTDLIRTRGQQIRLIVSEKDKKLRVETPGQKTLFKEAV